jgi:molecular chaperone DnaK
MRVEAESHAEEDRKRMEEVEARNRLDGIVYQAEKTIRENRDKLPEAQVKQAEEALADAKNAMNEGSVTRLRSATENVEKALHKMAEELYKTQQAEGAQQAGAAGAGAGSGPTSGGGSQGGHKPGDVIDAEYVDVDDNKKPN